MARLFRPLAEEIVPAPAAWDVVLRLADQPRFLFFDSALASGPLGRYSYLTADPFVWRRWRRGNREEDGNSCGDPLADLGELLARYPFETLPGLPPFQGGAAGLFGYDL